MKLKIIDELLSGEIFSDNVFISPYLDGSQSIPKSLVLKYLNETDVIYKGRIICSNDGDCQADASLVVKSKTDITEADAPHWDSGGLDHYKIAYQYASSLLITAKRKPLVLNKPRFACAYAAIVP